ncbi:nuclear transport factor 2 family protein [Nonomuraea sp. NPDC049607]|uniref:nuclear transport factor 2 family protein n=1 Tax=Nonomuraea sp. NPDC049607 TaxID=3154732 RepID=UPI0034346380
MYGSHDLRSNRRRTGAPEDWGHDDDEGHPAVPWIRPWSGRDEVADHYRSLGTHHVPELNATTVRQILVDGPDAVVLGRIVQTVRAHGVSYTSPFALHLTVEDGLITRCHIYEDSLTVAEAVSAKG